MRALRAAFGGRLRIWWVTHRHQVRSSALVLTLIACYGVVGHFDEIDSRNIHELVVARTAEMKRERQLIESLPPTVFILEGRTRDEALNRLSEIAGDLDNERYHLKRK